MKPPFYILVLVVFLFSCNNDDNAPQNTAPTINGTWSLVNVYGGFAGVDDDFENGTITWHFNQDNLELTVSNTNTTDVIYDGFPSGTYDYQILTTTGEDANVVVNSFSYDITVLTQTQLVLDEGVAADGFLLTFSR
ncbi:hypothetical protein [Winogradskyella forsetii]|uniref:hypothetical protein n=1 Tax=Winogradskyella forsetii TaxID=2686077 RepID=UPI0015B9073E|nr:hypothetical protein [Winogradskyella forsetii]